MKKNSININNNNNIFYKNERNNFAQNLDKYANDNTNFMSQSNNLRSEINNFYNSNLKDDANFNNNNKKFFIIN